MLGINSRSGFFFVAMLVATGCATHKKVDEVVQTTPTSGLQRVPLTVQEADAIVKNPLVYDGKTVTITGQIAKVISPRAFQVDIDGNLGNDEILVVMTDDNYAPAKDRQVEVTGTVRAFVEKDIEGEIDDDLDHEYFEELEGTAAIVAKPENVRIMVE